MNKKRDLLKPFFSINWHLDTNTEERCAKVLDALILLLKEKNVRRNESEQKRKRKEQKRREKLNSVSQELPSTSVAQSLSFEKAGLRLGLRAVFRLLEAQNTTETSSESADFVFIDLETIRPSAVGLFIGGTAVNSTVPTFAIRRLNTKLAVVLGVKSVHALAVLAESVCSPELEGILTISRQLLSAVSLATAAEAKRRKVQTTASASYIPETVVAVPTVSSKKKNKKQRRKNKAIF